MLKIKQLCLPTLLCAICLCAAASCPASAAIVLAEAANGQTITLGEEELIIQLKENPTTGFRWQLTGCPFELQSRGDHYTPDSPQLVGSGGLHAFTFYPRILPSVSAGLITIQKLSPGKEVVDVFRLYVKTVLGSTAEAGSRSLAATRT